MSTSTAGCGPGFGALGYLVESGEGIGPCAYCGTEIVWGALATTLDRELSLCLTCPRTMTERVALAVGIAEGRRSACSEPDAPFAMLGSGYPFASTEYSAAKRGWWAGHWTEQKDHALDGARAAMLTLLAAEREPQS